ncbi:MAG: hypothetical protein ABFD25_16820 [Clostridiaceae bacterium]
MKFKRAVSLLIIACFAAAMFSACEGNNEPDTTSKKSTGTAASNDIAATGTKEEVKKVSREFTYSINIMSAEQAWDKDERLKIVMNKYNIGFNFLPVSWNDWQQKVMIWMSSGDMPDVVWWDMQNTMTKDYYAWVKAGLLKEIKGVEKVENVSKYLNVMQKDDFLAVDGKKYAWPCTRDATVVDNISSRGFVYRKDWAKKLGLAKDDDVYTWDEMITFAKACIEKDPGGVGKNKVAGLAATTWAWPLSLGIEQLTMSVTDSSSFYKKEDGKYEWCANNPDMLASIKETKKLYDEGIIWKDQPLCKGTEPSLKFLAGEIAVMYDNNYTYHLDEFRTKIVKNFKDVKYEDIALMKVKAPNGKFTAIKNDENWCVSLFSAKMSDEKLNRLMQAWDWLLSDEGYYTRAIGIRGVDWEFDGDGIKYLWPIDETTKLYNRPSTSPKAYGPNVWMPIGVTEGFGFTDPNLEVTNAGKDVYDYSMWCKDNAVFIETDNKLIYFSGPNKDKYGSFTSEMKDTIVNIILGSKDVDKDWNDFIQSKQDKINLVLDEINNGIK